MTVEVGKQKRCVIYCRVSSHGQREAGTIVSQREELIAYAKTKNWMVVAVEEDDGVSGSIPPSEREAMGRVIDMVKGGFVEAVLVQSEDRISRDDYNIGLATFTKLLQDHGLELHTAKGHVALDTPEKRLLHSILGAAASFERAKIRERTMRGKKSSLRRGGRPPGQLPLGYAWDAEAKALVVDGENAQTVREIFRLSGEENLGTRAIAERLKQQGRTNGARWKTKAQYLTNNSIRLILAKKLYYTGVLTTDMESDARWETEPLVDEATWSAASSAVKRRQSHPKRDTGYPFLVRGLVRCTHCGRKMRSHTVNGRKYAYYECSAASRAPVNADRCTNRPRTRAEDVDDEVWRLVRDFIAEPDALQQAVDQTLRDAAPPVGTSPVAALAAVDKEIAKIADGRRRVLRLMARELVTEAEGVAQLEELKRSLVPHQRRRELLVVAREDNDARLAHVKLVETKLAEIRDVVDHLGFEQRRQVVMDLVDAVELDGVGRTMTVVGLIERTSGASGSGSSSSSTPSGIPRDPSSGASFSGRDRCSRPARPGLRGPATGRSEVASARSLRQASVEDVPEGTRPVWPRSEGWSPAEPRTVAASVA